jgi:capsid protein
MLDALRYRIAGWLLKYDATRYTPERAWIPGVPQAARLDLTPAGRLRMVNRARDAEHNVPLIGRILDLFELYAVGPGLVMQPDSSSEEWNERAAEWWSGWEKRCDLGSLLPFTFSQGVLTRRFVVDGEDFIVKTYDPLTKEPAIQFVESPRVATPPEQKDGNLLYDGVTMTEFGRPTGYWIGTEKFDESGAVKTTYDLKPASSVIHVWEPMRFGDVRGATMFHAVLDLLQDLREISKLELQAAKSAAATTEIITTPTGELDPAQMLKARFGMAKTGGATPPPGVCASTDPGTYYEAVLGARPKVIKQGDKYEQFRSERPSVVTQAYLRTLMELVCVGIGLPLQVVLFESTQGTTLRALMDVFSGFSRARSLVIQAACVEVYRYAMNWARVNVPTLRDAPGDWDQVAVYPPKSPNTDIGRNSQAELAELAAGMTTQREIYARRGLVSSRERRRWFEEQAADRRLATEFGVAPPAMDGKPVAAPLAAPALSPNPDADEEIAKGGA